MPDPAALRAYPGFLLSLIGRTASARFGIALAPTGLRPPHFGVINVLELSEGISQQDLGRTLGIDPSTMVGLLDELEALGLVERRRQPKDRRAYALHLTPEGHKALEQGRAAAMTIQDDLLAGLDADERVQLLALLTNVAANL